MTGNVNRKILMKIYDKLYKFYGPQGWWPGNTRFEIVVGAILTQNTAWTNVEKAIRNLKDAKAISHPAKIREMAGEELAALIRPSGYYNIKSVRLKNFVNFLSAGYGADLDRVCRQETHTLRQEMLAVNGIGPETCDSILLYAFKRSVFVVDAYTKRVFSRHGFFVEKAGYDEVQKIFMDNLPRDRRLYNEYHALVVRLGKEMCRTKPDCKRCPLRGINDGKLPCK